MYGSIESEYIRWKSFPFYLYHTLTLIAFVDALSLFTILEEPLKSILGVVAAAGEVEDFFLSRNLGKEERLKEQNLYKQSR